MQELRKLKITQKNSEDEGKRNQKTEEDRRRGRKQQGEGRRQKEEA